jgi:hypothetical protein
MGYFDTPVTAADGLSGYQRAIQLARMIEQREAAIQAQYRELATITVTMTDDEFKRYMVATEIVRHKGSRV